MRVISGRYRGLRLSAPPGMSTRPLTDQIKETIFNILGSRLATPGEVPEVDVLDLFAGSGSFGIEALSRGARSCVFVERDRRAAGVLRGNLARLSDRRDCRIMTENAWSMRLPRVDHGFGLIFLDPPFPDVSPAHRMLDLLRRSAARLAEDGLLVFRFEDRRGLSLDALIGAEVVERRSMGRSEVLLLSRATGAAQQQGEEEDGAKAVGQHADRELARKRAACDGVGDGQESGAEAARGDHQGERARPDE